MRAFIYAFVLAMIGVVCLFAPRLVRRRMHLVFSWPASESPETLSAIRVLGAGVLVVAAVIAYLIAQSL